MLQIEHLSKKFSDFSAVEDFNLHVKEGEFVTILGPSGSGKSTVLRMIAGLLNVSTGTIRIGARDVTAVPAKYRNIGLVFQSYALFPNMTVFNNIAFPLRIRKWDRARIGKRVAEMLDVISLGHRANYMPENLSGGERQRVALARALAFHPPLLLLDEPLSALDAKVRGSLRDFLKEVQRTTGVTTLMVTHDQEEALGLGDRIVVMNSGKVEQIGTPTEIYYDPASVFTRQFIGSVTSLRTKVLAISRRENGGVRATLAWPGGGFDWLFNDMDVKVGEEREIFIRPEAIEVQRNDDDGFAEMTVAAWTFLGAMTRLKLTRGPAILDADVLSPQFSDISRGSSVFARIVDRRLASEGSDRHSHTDGSQLMRTQNY